MRIKKDEYYLKIAEVVAVRGTCIRRNYGSVIVNNDEIISTGYTGSPRGEINCCDTGKCKREELGIEQGKGYEHCNSVHSEANAIISASRKDMIGATLYLVGVDYKTGKKIKATSCNICTNLIKNAGIVKVIGGE